MERTEIFGSYSNYCACSIRRGVEGIFCRINTCIKIYNTAGSTSAELTRADNVSEGDYRARSQSTAGRVKKSVGAAVSLVAAATAVIVTAAAVVAATAVVVTSAIAGIVIAGTCAGRTRAAYRTHGREGITVVSVTASAGARLLTCDIAAGIARVVASAGICA